MRRLSLPLYLGAIAVVTATFAALYAVQSYRAGATDTMVAALALLSLVAGSQFAVSLVNLIATWIAMPQRLPRMDFSKGIPEECRSLVAVPTMLARVEDIEALIESLEVRFLGNRSEHVHFALLTDFGDARTETMPEDEALLDFAQRAIEDLNRKYAAAHSAGFFLFHRPRRWNAREGIWMGRERKRGKLEDLNALLRGRAQDAFALVIGDAGVLRGVRYVITLDTDTQLPRDAARQLIEAMAHPLNRPRYDSVKQRVTAGYGILQPRVTASVADLEESRYARLTGGEAGIDPYTRAVSDVYQDLFGEGSFIGKGIYDVDAFEQALAGRLPANRILSHDLLEGGYARAGLLSDVQLFEKHPTRYTVDAARRHRWIRGDWQIASWTLPRVPDPLGGPKPNPLSALTRWKILDNLRRSLAAPALVALLWLTWLSLSPVWAWTLVLLGVVLAAPTLASLVELFRKADDVTVRQHLAGTARSLRGHAAQAAFGLACLPYEAFYSLDAMLRSTLRVLVKRRLLEWTTASEAESASRTVWAASYLTMWSAPATALAIGLTLAFARPAALAFAGPLLLLWLAAPAIAWWVSRPPSRTQAPLTGEDVVFLRKFARRTWTYFDEFVVTAGHHLPPDNYQEHPGRVVAHRTSPTNMGMALLANVSAYDFGYLPAGALLDRTARAFETMQSLERYQGHFYNWYDTQTLKPLAPLYVSSVDSGNLSGYLMVLRSALLALPDEPILHPQMFAGLTDTLRLLLDDAAGVSPDRIERAENHLSGLNEAPPVSLDRTHEQLAMLVRSLGEIEASLGPGAVGEGRRWAQAAANQARAALSDLEFVAPWLAVSQTREIRESWWAGGIPTLAELAKDGNEAGRRARERIAVIERLAAQADELGSIAYDFLYDEERHLLAIGYNVSERRRDAGYYDLLASEARFTVFTGISQQKLPQESWFALGRLLANTGGRPALMSWSGSMFEYLMPLLVMPTYAHTLLDQTYRAAVGRQIDYGRERRVPWGMSESGYNTFDASLNYQYRAFGVPGLGLSRGLADDLVIAPYASALALMVEPHAACRNLRRLARAGAAGEYGFYEAIDYTPARVPPGNSSAVVKSFMAHHQGMTLLALAYRLLGNPMQQRAERLPEFRSTLLLLHERVPKATAPYLHHPAAVSDRPRGSGARQVPLRVVSSPDTATPEVQLLSNGHYHVMVTNAGGGYSRWKDLAITRWREDATRDHWGTFCYVRDLSTGAFWSCAHHPTAARAETYEATFSESRVEFRRRDHDYETRLEIVVSPEDDIELRRLHITNRSDEPRAIDVTSYAEVVLAAAAADVAHPAFSNLFVQTELIEKSHALVCTRRPRSHGERMPWMFHRMAIHGMAADHVSYETDRARFVGRGRTLAAPRAMQEPTLSGSAGSVLDPIVSIRYRMTLQPNATATIDMVFGAAQTREECLALIGKYEDSHLADRVFDLSWTHSLVTLRQINAAELDAQLYGRLAGAVLYADPAARADAGTLIKNR
ncbi:MAG: glucoamylase family protein, partial [Burkholderiales bacterium]